MFLKRRYECLRSSSIPWTPKKTSAEGVSCVDMQHSCEDLGQACGQRSGIRTSSDLPSKTSCQTNLPDVRATLSALTENSVYQQTEMQELFRLQKLRDDSQLQLEGELRCALQRQRELEDELKTKHVSCEEIVAYNIVSRPNVCTLERPPKSYLERPKSHATTQTKALVTPAHRDEYSESSDLATEQGHIYRYAKGNHMASDLIGSAISSAIEECTHLEQQMFGLQAAVYLLNLLVSQQQMAEGSEPTRLRPLYACCGARAGPPIKVRI